MNDKQASAKQIAFIGKLLGGRQVAEDAEQRLRGQIDAGRLTSRQASDAIDWLMTQPWKPREGQRQDGRPAGLGVYQRDGRIFVVREFTPDGGTGKVRYAREIVTLRDTQGDRLDGSGERVRYEEIKAPGMQYQLRDEELVPMDELSALGIQFGFCVVCGTKLEVADSVERGIGPVCAKRQQARLSGLVPA